MVTCGHVAGAKMMSREIGHGEEGVVVRNAQDLLTLL